MAIGPGTTALTRIPLGASSSAATCVRLRSAPFEAEYDACRSNAVSGGSRERVHDGAATCVPEMRDQRLHAVEGAERVDPPHGLERVGRLPLETGGAQHAGVVHQDVEPTERVEPGCDERVPRHALPHVEWSRCDGVAQLVLQRRELVDEHVAGDDPRALLGEPHRDRATLPAGGTGHECDLALQLTHVVLPSARRPRASPDPAPAVIRQ